MNFGSRWGIPSWSGVGPLPPGREFAVLESAEPDAVASLVRMLGATHVVTRAGGSVERRLVESGFGITTTVDRLSVLTPPGPPPARFALAPRATPATTEEAVASARRGAAVDADGTLIEDTADAGGWNGDPSGVVSVVEAHPIASRLDVTVDRPTWLLARDPYYRRWTATVDGALADVRPAGGLFLAVRVPAGRHDVRLRYDEPGIRAGVMVALFCVLLVTPLLVQLTGPAD